VQTPLKNTLTLPVDDYLRPRYHFLPPNNWMNDPNGLIQWHGVYHLFYQHNPHGSSWGRIHWGHASSLDLVNWEHHPIALTPGPESYDQDGCWSGCAVDDDGIPTVLYTGRKGNQEVVCLARADPLLNALYKHPDNPVITHAPPKLDTLGFRDPYVWREGDRWNLLLGSGVRGTGGAVLLYTSQDLLRWEYQGLFCAGDGSTGAMWECPIFFSLGDRHVLLVSTQSSERALAFIESYQDGILGDRHVLLVSTPPQERVLAFVGSYQEGAFAPESWHWADGGPALYAPRIMRDHRLRQIFFAWIKEERDVESQRQSGWSGVLSLPRIWRAGDVSAIAIEPAPELAQLRTNPRTLAHELKGEGQILLPTNQHGQWELEIVLVQTAGLLTLTMEEGKRVLTTIELDLARRCTRLWDPENSANIWAPFTAPAGAPIHLRCFFDHSVMECFVQEQVSLTKRVYPHRGTVTQIILAYANVLETTRLQVHSWDMLDARFVEARA
jgi:beta-fructofuranosidase